VADQVQSACKSKHRDSFGFLQDSGKENTLPNSQIKKEKKRRGETFDVDVIVRVRRGDRRQGENSVRIFVLHAFHGTWS
jgi:hypothetical protein